MEKIKFYDVKGREVFTASKYEFKKKKTKRGIKHFAVAKAPSGIKAWRIVSEDFYLDNK